ncbi:MAG TPA: zf-HC2 domain-containing protein [Kofleriaceae bacterium]|nr:zf-HC2 domain-containing protein [Kofleriaceae bacterium]
MSCESIRKQLTAYLDGELEGDRGSVVRGHLRGCEDCRKAAADEAVLRDGLRALPPVDPPASLWAGVQAKLAAAEIADAEKPAWRRFLTRLAPRAPQLGFAGLAVAAAIIFFVVRARHDAEPSQVAQPTNIPPVVFAPHHEEAPPPAPTSIACGTSSETAADVTEQIAAEPAQLTACYAQAAHELRELLPEARAKWTDDHKHEVDAKLATFEQEVTAAKDDRARQKSYRAQIRYLQRMVIRDDVALASGGTP